MKLDQLIKPIDEMSDDELIERIREVRHRRETIRPARAKIVEKAVKKESRKKTTKAETLLDALSPAEREELIKKLSM